VTSKPITRRASQRPTSGDGPERSSSGRHSRRVVPFAVVLDASVLYPLPLRDTLLRMAETELYDPLWSARILDEVMRNLEGNRGASAEQTRHLRDAMTAAFDGAEASEAAIDRLEPAMTNDPKDRHVLAAAVASEAQASVTLNLNDFPSDACEPFAPVYSLHIGFPGLHERRRPIGT
jgi:predicted nucleic acid-binding protein